MPGMPASGSSPAPEVANKGKGKGKNSKGGKGARGKGGGSPQEAIQGDNLPKTKTALQEAKQVRPLILKLQLTNPSDIKIWLMRL